MIWCLGGKIFQKKCHKVTKTQRKHKVDYCYISSINKLYFICYIELTLIKLFLVVQFAKKNKQLSLYISVKCSDLTC